MPYDRDDIDRIVQEHYRSRSLDPATLANLRSTVTSNRRRQVLIAAPAVVTAPAARQRAAISVPGFIRAVAAAILVGVIGLFLYEADDPPAASALASRAAHEIALNHRKQFAIEFTGRGFDGLAAQMPKLDFQPFQPNRVRRHGYRFVGARYCSVGGQVAAQIRLQDRYRRKLTLYQFRPGSEFEELRESRIDVDGVSVQIWREGGLDEFSWYTDSASQRAKETHRNPARWPRLALLKLP